MRITDTADLWWKTAVVYCLDVETYLDWDGDGTGDLEGLTHRLDHLADLGVTCLWLMPFYPSPDRDDGYDITDFYGVDPRLGTHGDLVEVIHTARDRGMRVIVDLVVNHTSDQHPWFVSARSSRDSPYRDFYVWRDEPPQQQPDVVFPDAEDSVWTYDDSAGQHYLHRFYRFQPDLNVTSPRVRDEIAKIMGFWLALGVSGFRVDAVPFLLETDGTDAAEAAGLPEPHDYLRALRSFLERRTGDGLLLGEVNVEREQQLEFFGGGSASGGGDELSMQFDFITMQRTYLALARGEAAPIVEALASRPATTPDCQWATFVRNHDELTLDKLTDDEREEVFAAFGPEQDVQLYGRGLRRRLPPMLGGDARRIRMVYSLLFSLPGTPVLFYGEEIGMGEDLRADGRMAVRTPMQWSAGASGGFSTAAADALPGPVVAGEFGPDRVNVADQREDPGSLLQHVKLLARRYRECPEMGWGDLTVLEHPHRSVLAHQLEWDDARLVALHQLVDEAVEVPVRLDGVEPGTRLVDLLSQDRHDRWFDLDEHGAGAVPLAGYGHRWLRVVSPGDRRLV